MAAIQQKQMEVLEYWLISIPNQGSAEKTVATLRANVESGRGEYYQLDKLPTQRLKVGTLDKLIALSDELGRVDAFGKNVVQKLHRTYAELEDNTDQLLSVYNKTIRGYITNFVWDDGHFNPRAQLKELVQSIHGNMNKTAEHLRKWTSTLSEIQNQLSSIERKKTGSLMNKALNEYINHEDWYNGEYVTSALVVVPNSKSTEFMESYEFFEDTAAHKAYYDMLKSKKQQQEQEQEKKQQAEEEQAEQAPEDANHADQHDAHEVNMNKLAAADCRVVVPNSSKFLTKDAEFSLFRVLLLKRGYEWFKYVSMKNGYAVRDFNIEELETQNDEQLVRDLEKKEASQKKKLKLFCKNTFSETFANWMHLKIIRSFVESVLRFGLPVDFSISVVRPPKGNEKKLLKSLEQRYTFLLDKILQQKSGKDENEIDYSGNRDDFYPFVFTEIKCEL